MTLLKNNATLPLDASKLKSVAVLGPLLNQGDKNDDGVMAPDESYDDVGQPEKFETTPQKVNMPEIKRRAKEMLGNPRQALQAMDTDGDRKVSQEEFKAPH